MLKDRTNKTPLDLAKTMSQRCANILKDAQDTQDGLLSQGMFARDPSDTTYISKAYHLSV